MPQPINYVCTKCDLKGSSSSAWGVFNYKINDKLISIDRDVAVCYSCQSIVPGEILNTNIPAQSSNIKIDISHQSYYKEDLERFEALQERKSAARCLICSSHNFEMIPKVEPNKEQRRLRLPIRTGLTHKFCGGRIYADFNTPNFNMGDNLPQRIYNTEGISIDNI